jgi:ribosome-binding protein aMBF1 (putative translation factor)
MKKKKQVVKKKQIKKAEHQKVLDKISEKIKSMRKAEGLGYIPLSQKIGMERNVYYKCENPNPKPDEKVNFRLGTILRILDYYDISLKDFINSIDFDDEDNDGVDGDPVE